MTDRNVDRFRQIYLFGGEQSQDSGRFRVRLSSLYRQLVTNGPGKNYHFEIANEIEVECGVKVPWVGNHKDVAGVLEKGQMRDALDSISIVAKTLRTKHLYPIVQSWLTGTSRMMREENLAFRIDETGTVRRLVDEEFHRNMLSSISALDVPQLAGAKAELNRALSCLTSVTVDTKGAVRGTFEACEIVTKHLIPESNQLNARICRDKLPALCATPGSDAIEAKANVAIFQGMAEWVDASHNYRHGQALAEPVAPSMPTAVHMVSLGCGYIRRLAEVYRGQLDVAAAAPAR